MGVAVSDERISQEQAMKSVYARVNHEGRYSYKTTMSVTEAYDANLVIVKVGKRYIVWKNRWGSGNQSEVPRKEADQLVVDTVKRIKNKE